MSHPLALRKIFVTSLFPGCYGRRGAQHRDQIAMSTSFDAKNAKATVPIVETDAFD